MELKLNFVEGEVKTKIILHLEEAPLDLSA